MAEAKQNAKKDEYQKALTAFGLARKSVQQRNFPKASELLKDFLKKYSAETELADRAKTYLSISEGQQKKEAIPLKTFEDYYQYGIFTLNQGKHKEAVDLFEKAQKLNPDEGKIYYLLAEAYSLMNNNEQCLENLKKAIQIDKFYKILAQNEKDFEKVREDKKFKVLTKLA